MDADDKFDFVKNRTVRGHETEYRSATGNMTALAKARELIADQFEVAWGMYLRMMGRVTRLKIGEFYKAGEHFELDIRLEKHQGEERCLGALVCFVKFLPC